MSNRKVLLMILDGWGIGDGQKGDVIAQVHPAYISEMTRKYPHAQLRTDGENVGLPDGQMGNSEVGHLNIGAGRVVYQDLVKINRACRDDSILKNPEIVKAFEYAKSNGVSVHLMGLVSDGGVHSSLDHLLKLTDIADKYGIERTYVHCFMDGRDTDPYSGKGFIERLEKHMRERSTGVVASIVGRYYAMDRDKRWERVKVAYDLLVEGKGEHSSDMALAMQKSYDEGVTDEFVKPVVRIDEDGNPIGMIRPNDVVIFFNYRNDRAKELTIVLTQEDMPQQGMHTLPLYYCCMTPYDAKFEGLHILFDKENVADTIGEYVARQGLSQLRIAETEKYAHVTFFLNGGREEEFEGRQDQQQHHGRRQENGRRRHCLHNAEVHIRRVAAADDGRADRGPEDHRQQYAEDHPDALEMPGLAGGRMVTDDAGEDGRHQHVARHHHAPGHDHGRHRPREEHADEAREHHARRRQHAR